MNLSRRAFTGGAGIAIASLAFGINRATSAETLRIGLPAVYTPFAALQYASEQGYFGEAPVEITVFRGGSAAQEALAAGAVDVVAGAPPTAALAIGKGVTQKIVALAGAPTPQGWYLVAPPSGAQDAAALAGANIGITAKGSTTDFLAAWSAKTAGISINMVPLGAGIVPALDAGQIQAGVIWPLASFKAISSGQLREVHNYGDLVKDATFDVWAASTNAIESKADQMKAFLSGVGKAIEELQGNESKALEVLSIYHDEKDENVLKLAYSKLIKTMRPTGAVEMKEIQGALDMASLSGITGLPGADQIADLRLL